MRSPDVLSHVLLEFYVDGKSLPLVDFDIGPSWSGLIPISGAANETRKVLSFETFTDEGVVLLVSYSVILLVLSSGSRRKFG